jgi:hypothetical protein
MWQKAHLHKELQINEAGGRQTPYLKTWINLNMHFTKEDIQMKVCVQLSETSRKCKQNQLEGDLSNDLHT